MERGIEILGTCTLYDGWRHTQYLVISYFSIHLPFEGVQSERREKNLSRNCIILSTIAITYRASTGTRYSPGWQFDTRTKCEIYRISITSGEKQNLWSYIFWGNILNLNRKYSFGIYVMFSSKTFRQKSECQTNKRMNHFNGRTKKKNPFSQLFCTFNFSCRNFTISWLSIQI